MERLAGTIGERTAFRRSKLEAAADWIEGEMRGMVTDTAPFRYAHYHTSRDTPDRVDCDRLARVTAGLARVVLDLAGERD